MALLIVPFILQGALMVVDEFYCHWKRELGPWERWGHPVDTFFFGMSLAVTVWMPWSSENFMVFIGVCTLSTVVITKDEWVHTSDCRGFEQWLHAVLFILHPMVLGAFGFLWFLEYNPEFIGTSCFQAGTWINLCSVDSILNFRFNLIASVVVFGLYQILYWNVWRPLKK